MTHTPGDLFITDGKIVSEKGETILLSGVAVPGGNHPRQEEADANRKEIVRRWNAYVGLESLAKLIVDLDDIRLDDLNTGCNLSLRQIADNLLEDMERCDERPSTFSGAVAEHWSSKLVRSGR